MLKQISPQEMIGKTIKSVNDDYVNQLIITFTDKTEYVIEPEKVYPGIYSPIVSKESK